MRWPLRIIRAPGSDAEPHLPPVPAPHLRHSQRLRRYDLSKDTGNQPRLVTPIDKIPVPFDDTNKARDLFPAMSPRLTTATENLLIARILSTISREGFRFVGIAATDTRDKIFLITLIREFCPDVQIFFSDNDLLLAYPEYSRFLRGSIIASTYPLFPPNREWSPPHRTIE